MARNDIYTYFTQIGQSRLLYSAEEWVRVRLRLTTAGPVAIGTREDLVPVLSGKGILLVAGGLQSDEFVIPKGQRLFIAASSVNRVNYFVEPIPYLQRIINDVGRGFTAVAGLLARSTGVRNPLEKMPSTERDEIPCPDSLKDFQV